MIHRRNFIKFAGSALILNRTAAPASAQAPSQSYAYGSVVAVDGNMIYLSNDKGPVTLRVIPTSDIWRGQHHLSPSALKWGDRIDAVGQVDFDGALIVKWLFANIVNRYGQIVKVNGNQLELAPSEGPELAQGVTLRIQVNTAAPVAIINNGQGSTGDLQVGRFVQVIGLFRSDGSITATRIWVDSTPGLTMASVAMAGSRKGARTIAGRRGCC